MGKFHRRGNAPVHKRRKVDPDAGEIKVGGIWLRTRKEVVEVLAEVGGEWRVVIKDYYDGDLTYSHIVEPLGIANAPDDEVTT